MKMIVVCRLLTKRARVAQRPLRPDVIVHRNRPGFIERQDGSWINLPLHTRHQKPKARRRLWQWLTSKINNSNKEYAAWVHSINSND